MPVQTINGVPLHYRASGDPSKPTVVLCHPVLWGAEVFAPLIAALTPDFYLLALDLHGHGGSGYRTPLIVEEMAADYAQMLDQLGITKATWIGYSLGSMIGMHLALQQPAWLDKLVLLATNARQDATPLTAQTRQLWDRFRAGQRETIIDPALQLFFAQATYAQQPEVVAAYRRKAIGFQEVEGMYQAAMATSARPDVMEQLGTIQVPTLVIAGRADRMATPDEAAAIAARIPNAQLALVEESSHLLLVEKPQVVVQCIRHFLAAYA